MSLPGTVRMRIAVAGAIAGLALPQSSPAAITSGLLLTNFASATYSFNSGEGTGDDGPGVSISCGCGSSTAYVLVTDSPQLCMQGSKRALATWWGTPLPPPGTVAPGDLLCYEIGFSNCGEMTGWSVMITDVLPANVEKAPGFPSSLWVGGGFQSVLVVWATTLNGPWYSYSNTGMSAPMYMRWLLGKVGMHKSGYIRYCVTVL